MLIKVTHMHKKNSHHFNQIERVIVNFKELLENKVQSLEEILLLGHVFVLMFF